MTNNLHRDYELSSNIPFKIPVSIFAIAQIPHGSLRNIVINLFIDFKFFHAAFCSKCQYIFRNLLTKALTLLSNCKYYISTAVIHYILSIIFYNCFGLKHNIFWHCIFISFSPRLLCLQQILFL